MTTINTQQTTISTAHTTEQLSSQQAPRIVAQWGLPRDITPRFGARLIQRRYRLDFLSDRASLIGEWSEEAIDKLDQAFPAIIRALEGKLLTGELDAQRQLCITTQHDDFTCEADTFGSHGYVYIAIYTTTNEDTTHGTKE